MNVNINNNLTAQQAATLSSEHFAFMVATINEIPTTMILADNGDVVIHVNSYANKVMGNANNPGKTPYSFVSAVASVQNSSDNAMFFTLKSFGAEAERVLGLANAGILPKTPVSAIGTMGIVENGQYVNTEVIGTMNPYNHLATDKVRKVKGVKIGKDGKTIGGNTEYLLGLVGTPIGGFQQVLGDTAHQSLQINTDFGVITLLLGATYASKISSFINLAQPIIIDGAILDNSTVKVEKLHFGKNYTLAPQMQVQQPVQQVQQPVQQVQQPVQQVQQPVQQVQQPVQQVQQPVQQVQQPVQQAQYPVQQVQQPVQQVQQPVQQAQYPVQQAQYPVQ